MIIAEQVYAFYIPTVTFLGFGAHKQLGKQIKALTGVRKPFICTDKGVTKAEITQKIVDLVKADTGLDSVVFDETAANPTDNNVHDGLKVYQDYGCDMIISLGGGSSHDCAKGIGILATNGGDIRDYEGTDKSKKNMPPFIAVNTTAGTASEMTRFCIITDTSRKVKMPIIDQRVTPNVAINDPLLMMSMPPSLTAATGMDALTHAIEAYVSTMATPITDTCALKAISLITKSLRAAVANGSDPVARENMAYAEYLAGMAFNSASLGHVHAMAHQLGGFYDLPHGVSNAILLPHVEQYNLMAKMDRFVDIAVAMGEKVAGMSQRAAAERALEAMKVLASDIGIPGRLRDLGVREEDLPLMAKNAQKDACSFTNPRCPSLEDIVNIYKSAL